MLALHGPDLLRKRAVTRLTLAAMIASAMLAPLILGTTFLALTSTNWDSGPVGITVEMLCAAVLAMVPAACLGGLAMHRGAAMRSESSVLGWSVLSGVLFLGACVCCAGLVSFQHAGHRSLEDILNMMGSLLILTMVGSIVSGPTGFAFGLLFLVALSPLTARLTRPSIVTPAHASRGSAVMLLVASGVALLCASAIHGRVDSFAHDQLALDAPWLAFAVFPVPLVLCAFVFELTSLLETRAILRMRNAILSGAHPEYHPGDIVPEEDATPLTELDRKSTNKRLLLLRIERLPRWRGAHGERLCGLHVCTQRLVVRQLRAVVAE